MKRLASLSISATVLTILLGATGLVPVPAARAQVAAPAQTVTAPKPRPRIKGRAYKLKIDSSPQQAVVYWDAAATPTPREYGIAGYTPLTIVVPRSSVRVIIEMKGFRTQERDINVAKPESLLVTMEKAAQPARLEIVAGSDGGSTGADVSIDGVARGTLPNAFEVAAGRHNLEVKKVGWKTLTKWIDLADDERRTVEVVLERAEQPSGTLLVTSDAPGEVYVDGTRRDLAPAVITGLPPGEHIVEVRRDGATPWRQSVTITSGQQAKVAANLGGAAGAGLRIVSTEPNVEVFVDGESKGKVPVNIADIKAGQHLVEGRKPQFRPFEQTVEIVPGKQSLVQLKMEPGADDTGKSILRVQSTVPDAEVFLDGATLGKAPIDRHDLTAGKHYVIIRKEGYEEFKREVYLFEGQPVSLVADLRNVGKVKFLSSPEGADVTVDGEPIGKTPIERDDVSAGDHVITYRLMGYYDHKETITVVGGKERLMSPDLKAMPNGPSAEQVTKQKTSMSSFGARVLPKGGFTADLATGYPYILFARLTVGILSKAGLGLDVGVEMQSFFQMWTGAIHGRLQLVETGPFSVAVRASAGAGAGSNSRNTVFGDVSGIASLDFAGVVSVSADLRWSFWSDQFCPNPDDVINHGVGQSDYCKSVDSVKYPELGPTPGGKRFGGQRLYMGLTVAAAIDRRTSFFARLEFLPGAGIITFPDERMAFEDKYNSVMFEHDPLYYGTVGFSLKF